MAHYNEAIEVNSDDALVDLNLFTQVTQDIRHVIQQISELKSKKPDKWQESIQELQVEGCFHFLTLKKLNRMAQIRCKNLKDSTLESKLKLDGNNLRLQNLQYEISHLDREVNNCYQFKSRHEDIDLVPVQDFYQNAPRDITKEEKTRGDTHLQTLARLDWELENRKALKEDLKRTHKMKEEVSGAIKKKKHDLDSLRPNLESVLKSTLQLQEALGDHITATRVLNENARLLPRPLYVLFFQAKAYAEACDPTMDVLIEGDRGAAEEMKQFAEKKFMNATEKYVDHYPDDSDSENEERDEPESGRGRRKSTTHSRDPVVMSSANSCDDLSKHPLHVCLRIQLNSKPSDSHLQLKFYYITQMEFVTVEPSLDLQDIADGVKDNPLLSSKYLLHNLQEVDEGSNFPNKVKGSYFSKDKKEIVLGKNESAYLWTQRLAGMEFLDEKESDMQISFANMALVIKLLKRRVHSRLSLCDQLQKFSANVVTCDSSITDRYAPSFHFELTSWKKIDFKTYSDMQYTVPARQLGLALPSNHFYIATLKRGASATVEAAVVISDQYPKQWPLFSVFVSWQGKYTAQTSLNVREIEVEVNCRLPEVVCRMKHLMNQILSAQMYRLLTLLDVYVETECIKAGNDRPAEFATSKLCPRVVKGPARLKPFKYDAKHKFQNY